MKKKTKLIPIYNIEILDENVKMMIVNQFIDRLVNVALDYLDNNNEKSLVE